MMSSTEHASNLARQPTDELSDAPSETETDTDTDPPNSRISYIEQLENDLRDFRLASRELEVELEAELEASEKRESNLMSQLVELKSELEYERERNLKLAKEHEISRQRLTSQLEQQSIRLKHAQENLRTIEIENDQMARSGRAHESLLEQYISQNSDMLEQLALAECDRVERAEEYKALEELLQRTREELQDAHDELYRVSSAKGQEAPQQHSLTHDRSTSNMSHVDADASLETVGSGGEQDSRSGVGSLRRMATMISQVGLLEQSVANVRKKMSSRRASGNYPVGLSSNRRSASRSASLASSDFSPQLLAGDRSNNSINRSSRRHSHMGSPASSNVNLGILRAKSLSRPKLNNPSWHLTVPTNSGKATPSANSAAAALAARSPHLQPKRLAAAGHGQPIL